MDFMSIGIFLSAICCILIGITLYFFSRDVISNKPVQWKKAIYLLAPYGLAISAYYYIFALHHDGTFNPFEDYASMSLVPDIILNIVLPVAILGFLVLSFRMTDKIILKLGIIIVLSFILFFWIDVFTDAISHARMRNTSVDRAYPLIQWSAAVFIVALAIAVMDPRSRFGKKTPWNKGDEE
jgi:hypothetical protein